MSGVAMGCIYSFLVDKKERVLEYEINNYRFNTVLLRNAEK